MATAFGNGSPSPPLTLSGSPGVARYLPSKDRSSWQAGLPPPTRPPLGYLGRFHQRLFISGRSFFSGKAISGMRSQGRFLLVPSCTGSSSSSGGREEPSSSSKQSKTSFGYTRKDVLLIGLGVTVLGVGLKSGLELVGVDPLQAGNAVQLVLVLGLTVGWISTYMFRVANKDMTYAQQLKDYEKQVMEKRLESLSEAELEAFLEQVEEEKRQLASGDQVN